MDSTELEVLLNDPNFEEIAFDMFSDSEEFQNAYYDFVEAHADEIKDSYNEVYGDDDDNDSEDEECLISFQIYLMTLTKWRRQCIQPTQHTKIQWKIGMRTFESCLKQRTVM